MKTLFFLLLSSVFSCAFGQTLGRSSIGSFGGSTSKSGVTIQSTGGQGSSTETTNHEKTTLRQGFIQPVQFIELTDEIGLNVYPNPSSGQFDFETNLNESDLFTFNIVDENGKIILNGNAKGTDKTHVSMDNVLLGVYYLKIESSKGVALSKIVITSK